MAANANFTTKLTLKEANVIRTALEERQTTLMNLIGLDVNAPQELREEAGIIDKLLRIDF